MLGSTIPISIAGAQYAINVRPFWEPIQYSMYNVSTTGSEELIKNITQSLLLECFVDKQSPGLWLQWAMFLKSYSTDHHSLTMYIWLTDLIPYHRENKDKTEIYLAFGATRMEACRPIVVQALKVALTPSINSMR